MGGIPEACHAQRRDNSLATADRPDGERYLDGYVAVETGGQETHQQCDQLQLCGRLSSVQELSGAPASVERRGGPPACPRDDGAGEGRRRRTAALCPLSEEMDGGHGGGMD